MIRTAAVVSLLVAGPTFAGDSVMWGEVGRTGALRVMNDGDLVHRLPPAENRNLVELEASSERFALVTSTTRRIDDDRLAFILRARGGPLEGPVEPLRAPCGVESVAVDGDRIAVASCGIAIHGPTGVTTLDVGDVHDVSLAGRYVAWVGDDIVVHDLASGTDVVRVTVRGLPDEVAVQPDGTVAFTSSDGERHRVAWAAPGTPGVIQLDSAPYVDGLRAAGGRVLYERRGGRRDQRRTLVLRTPADGTVRRLARFTARRPRMGDLALDAERAAWGVAPAGKRMRIVVREL